MQEIVWQISLYTFVTTWATIVVVSVAGCVFLRCTPTLPGLYPSRGLKGHLLLYRVKLMDQIQRLWTWSIIGQYLRTLAGVRFGHPGASECDVMLNLVPELARADSRVRQSWSFCINCGGFDRSDLFHCFQRRFGFGSKSRRV